MDWNWPSQRLDLEPGTMNRFTCQAQRDQHFPQERQSICCLRRFIGAIPSASGSYSTPARVFAGDQTADKGVHCRPDADLEESSWVLFQIGNCGAAHRTLSGGPSPRLRCAQHFCGLRSRGDRDQGVGTAIVKKPLIVEINQTFGKGGSGTVLAGFFVR
jgi:hypothetical protein